MKQGERLGKCRIVRQIEPSIWLVQRTEDFDQDAVAVFAPESMPQAEAAGFRERRRKLASLEHPAIPRFLDAGESSGGVAYNLFEWVPDQSALEIARKDKWNLARRLTLALQHADALALAHRNLLAHGGLTADSFRVTSAGDARIALFPATALHRDPVEGDLRTAVDFLARLIAESGIKKLPRDLQAIVDKARDVASARSYASAHALQQDLRAFLEHRPVSATPAAPLHNMALFARRRPELFFPAIVLLATILAAAVYSFAMESSAQRSRAQAQIRLRQLQQLTYSLESNVYEPVSKLPNSATARRTLIEWTSESLDALRDDAGTDEELRTQLVAAYRKLAGVLRANGETVEAVQAELKAQGLVNRVQNR